MLRVVRTALVWLLAAALPFQAYAAATMLACGTEQAPSTASAAPAHSHHAVSPSAAKTHLHHSTGAVHHTSSFDGADRAYSGPDPIGEGKTAAFSGEVGAPDFTAADQHSLQKCSVCSACCTAAALPAAIIAFEPVAVTDRFDSLEPRSIPASAAMGPERPPRPILV